MKKLTILAIFFSSFSFSDIPVEDFYKFDEFFDISISPEGKYFAAKQRLEDEKRNGLIIIDRKTMMPINTIYFDKGWYVNDYYWLSEERIAIRKGKHFGGLKAPYSTGFFWAVNVDGSKGKMIQGDLSKSRTSRVMRDDVGYSYFEVVDLLDSDPKNILIAVYNKDFPEIYKVNVYSGKKKKIMTSPAERGSVYTDTDGIIRAAFGENKNNENVFYYRYSEEDEWERHGTFPYGEGVIQPIAFVNNSDKLWVKCSINNPVPGICIYNPETYQLKEVYRNERVEPYNLSFYPDSLNNEDAEPELVLATFYDGKPKTIWFNEKNPLGKKKKALEKAFPGYRVSFGARTRDSKEIVVYVRSDKDPGGYYLFNTETNQLNSLGLDRRPWTKVNEMVESEPISYKARDGLEIHGYLHRPKGEKENLPMVVYVHGGPHGVRDYWTHDREAQYLANRGYAVLQINYRGSGGYGNEFLRKGFLHWGDKMQDDLTDGVEWAIKEGIADKERLCIYGASYGGYASMMSAARYPDLYKCAIGYVGVYDVASFTSIGNIPNYRAGASYLDTVIPSDPETRKKFSPSEQANKIKAAVFLIHGREDKQAHFRNYQIMTKKFDQIGKPYKGMVKDGEGHGFYDRENTYELARELVSFLDEHIGK
mgnify:FL=1